MSGELTRGPEPVAFNPESHCAGIFERLEHFTPEQRAHLFYKLEVRWCWDCGKPQAECECQAEPPQPHPKSEPLR